MIRQVNRRGFLKATGAVGAGIGLTGLGAPGLLANELATGAPNAEKLGWRLGCYTGIFTDCTFFGAIDKTASLGLHYVEAGSRTTSDTIKTPVGPDLSPADRKAVLNKLTDTGVALISMGYWVDYPCDRRYFDFAKEMGIEQFVAEPREDAFETLDKLCNEYGINFGVHDHPKPSRFWNPDTVLKVCHGRSRRIGACADTGHWMRSGLDPAECIKKLEGRIISFHFKDLNQFGAGHDVPWGSGVGGVKQMLTEVHRQRVKVPFFIEYEFDSGKLLPEIAQSVAYFDNVAAELASIS
jgi:sugar phosphate isomerase/epimerase